jgi:hypothetical protein
VARPGARPHGDDDPTTRLRFHLYDAPLRRSCCCRCYADCRPHFRLGSGGGLYSAHNTFFHWCRTPSSSDPPRLRFVASTSSALPRLCPGASCASSNREFVLKKLCPKSPWVYSLSFAYIQLCPKSPWVYSPSFAAAAAAAAAPAGPAAPADLADIVGSRPTAAQSNIRRHPATTKLG